MPDRSVAATAAAASGMITEGNEPRQPDGRGASMTERELIKCAQRDARKPQHAAVDGPACWSGPSEAVDGLPHATNRSRIGPRRTASGVCQFSSRRSRWHPAPSWRPSPTSRSSSPASMSCVGRWDRNGQEPDSRACGHAQDRGLERLDQAVEGYREKSRQDGRHKATRRNCGKSHSSPRAAPLASRHARAPTASCVRSG